MQMKIHFKMHCKVGKVLIIDLLIFTRASIGWLHSQKSGSLYDPKIASFLSHSTPYGKVPEPLTVPPVEELRIRALFFFVGYYTSMLYSI